MKKMENKNTIWSPVWELWLLDGFRPMEKLIVLIQMGRS